MADVDGVVYRASSQAIGSASSVGDAYNKHFSQTPSGQKVMDNTGAGKTINVAFIDVQEESYDIEDGTKVKVKDGAKVLSFRQ